MTDRELLELAAKAAGYTVVGHYEYGLKIECHDGGEAFHPVGHLEFKYNGDKQTTTRFAISMLASEIGKAMK